jgi:hypothetical protein
MKTAILVFVFTMLGVLAGCSAIQQKVEGDIAQQIAPVAEPDLKEAASLATAAHNSSATCWNGLLDELHTLESQASTAPALPQIAGLATLLELGSEAQQNPPTPLQLPKLPRAVHDSCAGLLLDDQALLTKFGFGALLGIKGAGAVKAAAELQALSRVPHP